MTTLISHDDHYYLSESFQAFQGRVPSFVFVNRLPFFGEAGDWQKTVEVAEAAGATVVVGEWQGEIEHRAAAGEHLLSLGYIHALLPDGNEMLFILRNEPLSNTLLVLG